MIIGASAPARGGSAATRATSKRDAHRARADKILGKRFRKVVILKAAPGGTTGKSRAGATVSTGCFCAGKDGLDVPLETAATPVVPQFNSRRTQRGVYKEDALPMNISRAEIAQRCLILRCPNCGEGGLLRNWFRLRPACQHCGLTHAQEEGFTLGTTSIGYVVAIVVVVIPVCFLVVMKELSVLAAVLIGIFGSVALTIALYPLFLCWVVMSYYIVHAEGLPGNRPAAKPSAEAKAPGGTSSDAR